MANGIGPQTQASKDTFSYKYCQRGEQFRDVCNRVAGALKDNGEHFYELKDLFQSQRVWLGGRILSTIGTLKCTTPYNCFVSGPIRDAFVHGEGNIMQRAHETAITMRLGGGIGHDFSTLRPRGDKVTKLDSMATGPVGFFDIFNSVGKCTSSTGERRGAQMGILRVDHPDIEEFIHCKQNSNQFTGFNLSIAITDEFMEAVRDRGEFDLKFGGRVYKTIEAINLWEMIMRSTWDWGEPGVVFIDRINYWNNLRYCETIAATNPCSEQPLPPFGACLLGYFNLTQYVKRLTIHSVGSSPFCFDLPALIKDVPAVVRAVDNVIDIATYPLPEQEDSAKATRRMGLGVMGMANAFEACGYPYGSDEFCKLEDEVLGALKNACYRASMELAREKGPFPLFKPDYLNSPFIQGLEPSLQDQIAVCGIRNSHLTSIAPTGTTSFCADNVSSGIEPVFDIHVDRNVRGPDGIKQYRVTDYGYDTFGVRGRTAAEVTVEEHVRVLTTAQKHIDSAISKTVNVGAKCEFEDFKAVYFDCWKRGAKGCATYRIDGKRSGIMAKAKDIAECENGACAA